MTFVQNLEAVRETKMEERIIDLIIDVAIEYCISLEPAERGDTMNLRTMISVRMTVDEGIGYKGGQRLAYEKLYLLDSALNQHAGISWAALRELRLDRTEYGQGLMAGFQDELAGTAQPLPAEQPGTYLMA
jgi:hypothetical protein